MNTVFSVTQLKEDICAKAKFATSNYFVRKLGHNPTFLKHPVKVSVVHQQVPHLHIQDQNLLHRLCYKLSNVSSCRHY